MVKERIPRWMREWVVHLHGARCLACGMLTYEGAGARHPACRQIDHVIPERHGGRTWLGNLQVLCLACHKAKTKGNQTIDYRQPGWDDLPIHLLRAAGGCQVGDWSTLHVRGRTVYGRQVRHTRDPFAVTCWRCYAMPKMQWFLQEVREFLAAA